MSQRGVAAMRYPEPLRSRLPVELLAPEERRQYTMIHEAAHAVIGDVLGVPITRIHVGHIPGQNWLGHIAHAGVEQTELMWQRDPYLAHRTMTEVLHAHIFLTMAAAEAEEIIIGRRAGGDGIDRQHIEEYFDQLDIHGADRVRWEARMRRHTQTMVRRYKRNIMFVWRYLLKRPIVKWEELDALLYSAKLYAE